MTRTRTPMTRQPKRTPRPAPAAPWRTRGHETTISWICCDTVFEDTRGIIEHLRMQHGIDTFRGEATLNGGVTVGDRSIEVYECRLAAGVTVTKTVSTTAVTP